MIRSDWSPRIERAVGLMPLLTTADKKNAEDFFHAISGQKDAYRDITFSYVAIKQVSQQFLLTQGRIFLNTEPSTIPLTHFDSVNVRAGCYRLTELKLDLANLVDGVTAETMDTPHGPLWFPSAPGGRYGTRFTPFHPDGVQTQRRLNVLTIMGTQPKSLRQPDIDWEIMAASTPYDGIRELMSEYRIGPSSVGDTVNIEIIAFNVAAIDAARSVVAGEDAAIHVLLAPGLMPKKVSVGYRVYKPGLSAIRGVSSGSSLEWSEHDAYQRGVASIRVPNAAVLNCTVSYDGIAQHHLWLTDPSCSQNPRRAVHEAFDPKLETIKEIIGKALRKGQEARDLEAAMAWLLWMLGFSVAQLGGTSRTQDAADLVATTPSGHFAVIECTTGLLKADNKLPLLHDRAQAVRRALETSAHNQLRVLPIIVTTKSRDEITPDLGQAERLGILVLSRENLEGMLDLTIRLPTPDQIYDEAIQTVRTAQTKHESQDAVASATPKINQNGL